MKRVGRAVEFLAWALFFAFAALVLAMRFWLLPDIERYRDDIVAAVSRTVGQPVKIGGIDAGWLGLNPSINLNDVRIYDREGREALVLPSVENVVSWSSLARGKLKLHSLAIEGLRLQVRRDAEGAVYVAGMKLSGGNGQLTDWLLAQDEIVLRNAEIEWHDERRGAPPLALSALNLRLRNRGHEHSIGLTAHPPAALGSTVDLRALLDGRSVADPAAWSGLLYAELGYTDLAAWRAWIDYPWQVDQGQGAVRMWLTLDRGEMKQATADLALAQVAARLGKDLAPLRLASVQGRLQARIENEKEQYELVGRGLALAVADGPSIGPSDFQLSWTAGRDPRGTLVASVVELEPLAHLAASLPLPDSARKMLAAVKPRGRLADARLEWRGVLDAPERFTARAKFADLAVAPSGELPGFAGITGSLDATEASARIVLATRKSEIDLPRVFPAPLRLDFLNGLVEWERRGESGFEVRVPSLSFSNEHLSGNAHGNYAHAGSGAGIIDLSAQFNRAEAAHLGRYLPHARLMGGDKMRDWLTSAIVAGHSGDVKLRLRGDLREFPFSDPLHGQFTVSARIEKGVLDYADGWPRIHDINGELLFERDRMEIVGRSGHIQNAALANVRVSIPHLADPSPLLTIAGQADGATADFLKFIELSPVRSMIRGVTDPMSASGRGKLRLKLDLPLKDLPKTRVAGEYEFAGSNLSVHPQLPPIERAAGKLAFTESTLSVQDVRGQLFGGSVAINGGTRADSSVEIVAKGDATVAGTRPLFDHPWRRYLSGTTTYVATLNAMKGRTQISVESGLQGVLSTLPPPLAKSAAESLPLRVDLVPEEGGARDRISVRIGRIVAADILRRRQGEAMVVQRAGVGLTPAGNAPPRLPERPGTLVSGALPALDLDKWLPLFSGPGSSVDATAFDVRIGILDLYGKRMNEVALRAGADAAGWSASVSAQEMAGDLSYRKDRGGRLVARFTHLRVPDEYPGAQPRELPEPRSLPSIDLIAERFTYRGKQLGRVEVAGQRDAEDWRIDKVAITNPEATFSGSGVWRGGAPSRSSLDFDLNTSDAGQFLARVGYPDLVKGGKAQLKGALAWNGDPGLIDYPSLSGDVQLQAESGQFLEIEPGIGKLISLMSLQSLPRRISLDFRDVFSKGFEFQRIASTAHLEGGVMEVREFGMRGSAAQVSMSGEVDLARETQNLRVRVVPSLGDTASTVIALVNPLLAIPAAIAQKILKDPLGHIFAFDYSITGGWADPKVAKLGIEARAAEGQGSSQ
jgi:uncharacterized protein (TIGR02099 family)